MKTYRSKLNRFKNLDRFSIQQVKALFGFHPAMLAEILFRVLPELERRRAERLAKRPDRKRPYLDNDGRPREVTWLHKALMRLIYLRHNVSHGVVGALFDLRRRCFRRYLRRGLAHLARWGFPKRNGKPKSDIAAPNQSGTRKRLTA